MVVTSVVGVPGLYVTGVGLGLLWISALVTLYTGYDYFKAGVRHLVD
jgi:cardiolipin synthase